MTENSRAILQRRALQAMESLAGSGVQQFPKPVQREPQEERVFLEEQPEIEVPRDTPAAKSAGAASSGGGLAEQLASTAGTLEILRAEVAGCELCQDLANTRTQTVFGVGNPQARLCFLGEAPGADEDRQGEPFVGRAGQLLNRILAACQLSRDDVYILNVLKCRPPENRNPTLEESQHCRRFLDRQLQLIQPDFLCCLGAVSAQNLLDTTVSIGRLRGRFHEYQGIQVLCTYHPAYLLRNPSAKKDTWDDMKLLMREMGTPVG